MVSTVRDNVILELGLFIGQIGLERTYFLIPEKEKLHIASDLIGLTPLTYNAESFFWAYGWPRTGNLLVKRMLKELGMRRNET